MSEVDDKKLQITQSPMASEEIAPENSESPPPPPKPSKPINYESFKLDEGLTAERLDEIKHKIVDGSATPLDLELWKKNAGKAGAKAIVDDMSNKVGSAKARNVY